MYSSLSPVVRTVELGLSTLTGCCTLWTLTAFRSCFDILKTEQYRRISLVSKVSRSVYSSVTQPV